MRFVLMEPLVTNKSYHRWADSVMSPGIVGSVGDVLVTPFLKTSTIQLPRRVDPTFADHNACLLGSNISDGDLPSYTTGATNPRTYDSAWGGNRSFRDVKGWVFQDLRVPDKMVEPFVSSLGDYSWRNKVAKVNEAFRTGYNFAPVPGEYSSNGVPRGGQIPRATEFVMDDTLYKENSFMPTLMQKPKLPELPKKPAETKSAIETMADNAAKATEKIYKPLTADEVKDFEKNSPMTQYKLTGM